MLDSQELVAEEAIRKKADRARRRIAHLNTGLPADFVAAAITELGSKFERDYHSYNIVNPHEDAVSLDVIVDWLIDAGEDIQRIDRYDDWFTRFDTAVRGLPEPLRKYSVYTMMDGYQKPQPALRGSAIAADMFAAALRQASNGPSSIPHITPSLVRKYATDLRKLGLASSTRPNAHSNKSQS
ncbi:hypothetical protein [Mycolicibacterium bacteremicum]|uniref:hypothetical protein n=1 Tax=Mycolicibacterium bacteremicum TaxID=564198 RepID=UPI0026EE9EFF|nr:hypothetical protein [Mycolicibacterium bacteremicum]